MKLLPALAAGTLLALSAPLAAPILAPPALAAASDPAAAQIETFYDDLLKVMKQADSLGPTGRYKQLEPEITRIFDLPAMTRTAVGSSWDKYSDAQHQALITAFSRMTIATYAMNFDGFGGERFVVAPDVAQRGDDKVVSSQIVLTGNKPPVSLIYRLHQVNGSWRVFDVLYNGSISSLAAKREEFSGVLASGGPDALIAALDKKSDAMLARKK